MDAQANQAPKPPAMSVDVPGRIANTPVPYGRSLLPVFEAVINSIHACEDRFGEALAGRGRITVRVERLAVEQPLIASPGKPAVRPLASVAVTDNGVGFTDANFASFLTADSTAKSARGGRGLGRFTWLKVFQCAHVESVYEQGDQRFRRGFHFLPQTDAISGHDVARSDQPPFQTTIRLERVQAPYRDSLRMGADVIADKLFEHCFNYLILEACPEIMLRDEADESSVIVINDRVKGVTVDGPHPVSVDGHQLSALHVERAAAAGVNHFAHLCANKRVVESFKLADHCDLGQEPYRNAKGDAVVHHVFVSGPDLDAAVDSSRTRLALADDDPAFRQAGILDVASLRKAIGLSVDERLADVLRFAREDRMRWIEQHIQVEAPEFRHLISQKREELGRIRRTSDKSKLDRDLYGVSQRYDAEVRERMRALEKVLDVEVDPNNYREELESLILQLNEAGRSNLVRYVVRRRAVLQILSKLVSKTSGPAREDRIHGIIFPQRRTADEVALDDHNLWLVDDSLAFYEFLASDLPMSQTPVAGDKPRSRPDIVAYKQGEPPFSHVALIEFKRPERDDDNPVEQLVSYANQMRKGGWRDRANVERTPIPLSVRIDGFAICTIGATLAEQIRLGPGEMAQAPEADRWYGHHKGLNLSLEVLDFSAFLRRAQQRNRAFFHKLNLPNT